MIKKTSIHLRKPKSFTSYSLSKAMKVYESTQRKSILTSTPNPSDSNNKGGKGKKKKQTTKKVKSSFLKIQTPSLYLTKLKEKQKLEVGKKQTLQTTGEFLSIDPLKLTKKKNNLPIVSWRPASSTEEKIEVLMLEKKKSETIRLENSNKNSTRRKNMKCKIIKCSKIPFVIERPSKKKTRQNLDELLHETLEISEIERRQEESSLSLMKNVYFC